jgi:hypothetical protein
MDVRSRHLIRICPLQLSAVYFALIHIPTNLGESGDGWFESRPHHKSNVKCQSQV